MIHKQRKYLLPDFDQIRLNVWILNSNCHKNNDLGKYKIFNR